MIETTFDRAKWIEEMKTFKVNNLAYIAHEYLTGRHSAAFVLCMSGPIRKYKCYMVVSEQEGTEKSDVYNAMHWGTKVPWRVAAAMFHHLHLDLKDFDGFTE